MGVPWLLRSVTLLTLASSSFASTNELVIEEIVVTGSRIPRVGFETLQPATVLDGEEIRARGTLDIARNLNEQAGFINPVTPFGPQEGSVGRNLVNFLGLGVQRTLTLVNGHRFPANSEFNLAVDLNAIPEALVQRVETIAVGGAPIYGSDAIAGTVNVILLDDYEGFEFNGSVGGSPEFHDAGEARISATWGTNFANDRGNIALSGQFFTSNGLKRTDRPATDTISGFQSPGDPDSPYALEFFDDLVVAVDNHRSFPLFFGNQFGFNVLGNGVPLDINDPASPLSQFDSDGNMIAFVPGGGTGSPIVQNGGDGLRNAELNALNTDLERHNANLLLGYNLTDTMRFRSELWYARTDSEEIVNQPFFNSPAFGGLPLNNYGNVGQGPIPVLIDNPFLTEATRSNMLAALNAMHDFDGDGMADPTIDTDGDGVPDEVGFWRGDPTDIFGNREAWMEQDTYRLVLGLDGEVVIGERNYVWNAAYTWGRVETVLSRIGVHQPNFEQAVQVVVDTNGQPACADPSGGCAPLNVVGSATPQATDFVTDLLSLDFTVEQHVFSANMSGDVAELPAGPLAAAIGLMYRKESVRYEPDPLAVAGLTRFPLGDGYDGKFSSSEVYGEVVVPILGGSTAVPLVEVFEFEGAVRFVDNSVVGEDTTWTAGLRYRPIEDIEFRGNVTESIRAPSLGELFLPESVVSAFAGDPCDSRFIGQGNVPDVRAANCAAAGITQPFQSFVVTASLPGVSAGNRNLESERAKSTSYGVVLRPRFWAHATLAVDWFDIKIKNAIEQLNLNDLMIACFDSSSFSSEPACDLFTRNSTGQVADFREGYVNVAEIEFAGMQVVADYTTAIGRFGDLTASLNYLFTDKHLETPGSGNTLRLDGQIGESSHRATLGVTWDIGNWSWYNQLRWLDGAVFNNADGEFTRNIKGIDDWLVVNSSVRYRFNDNLDVQLIVDNLFDTDPPSAAMGSRSRYAYYAGILGRYARVQVRYVL